MGGNTDNPYSVHKRSLKFNCSQNETKAVSTSPSSTNFYFIPPMQLTKKMLSLWKHEGNFLLKKPVLLEDTH